MGIDLRVTVYQLGTWTCELRCNCTESTHLDSLPLVFFLFRLERQLDEQLLQLLVAVVYAELLKAGSKRVQIALSLTFTVVIMSRRKKFNDVLKTFNLRLGDIGHVVKD